MRDPARNAAQREQRGEYGWIEADRTVDQTGVEVDVRVQVTGDEVFVVQRDLFQLGGHVEQCAFIGRQLQGIGTLHDLLQIRLGDGRARIVRLVHTMAEAGDALTIGLGILHEFLDGRAGIADGLELAKHGLVRTAVQWARQRIDAGRDGGIQIGVCGTGDAYHRGGAVLLMVGMDDEQSAKRVHIQRIGVERLVRNGEAHAQEVIDIAA